MEVNEWQTDFMSYEPEFSQGLSELWGFNKEVADPIRNIPDMKRAFMSLYSWRLGAGLEMLPPCPPPPYYWGHEPF